MLDRLQLFRKLSVGNGWSNIGDAGGDVSQGKEHWFIVITDYGERNS